MTIRIHYTTVKPQEELWRHLGPAQPNTNAGVIGATALCYPGNFYAHTAFPRKITENHAFCWINDNLCLNL